MFFVAVLYSLISQPPAVCDYFTGFVEQFPKMIRNTGRIGQEQRELHISCTNVE